jgi:mono/diheme cytochrome c family protein
MWKNVLIGASAIALAASAAIAQDAGRNEYMVACAVCHGESGMGDGPFTSMMNVDIPSLTQLSQNNEGEFPYLEVFQIVDGRTGVRGHGGPMPIWGSRFSEAAQEDFGVYGAEVVTRGRVAVLVDYIESIQE